MRPRRSAKLISLFEMREKTIPRDRFCVKTRSQLYGPPSILMLLLDPGGTPRTSWSNVYNRPEQYELTSHDFIEQQELLRCVTVEDLRALQEPTRSHRSAGLALRWPRARDAPPHPEATP